MTFEQLQSICAFINAKPYGSSAVINSGGFALMADFGDADMLVLGAPSAAFTGEKRNVNGTEVLLAPLTHENARALRECFPYAAPSNMLTKERTLGVGDRLGIAGSGHIRTFLKFDAYPILAQQSIRELTLTERTFEDVLDCASYSVFREGFKRGFGADGDHLKKPEEVEYALHCGYTMITLDCSEHIRNDVSAMTDAQVEALPGLNAELFKKYGGLSVKAENETLRFSGTELKRMLFIYGAAIDFAVSIYERYVKNKKVDFEISIDETETPTTPLQHYFVANELLSRGVKPATVAPRFCGEFQKGIDYIGSLSRFRAEFAVHAAIARHFGYKISVHSGSDKFSVFPTVGTETRQHFHVKTAGTNWLEAMRLIAKVSPALYREVHAFALDHFTEAKKYYHVTTDLTKVPPLSTLKDSELPALFDLNEARQLIHITYGLILSAKDGSGCRFKTRLYKLWREHKEEYALLLERHIGKHLELLGVPRV